MKEENGQTGQEESIVEEKEPERVFPPLLEVDLDELGLEDGEVFGLGEVVGESESEPVVARRKSQSTSV